jgi:hypothetical protein
VDRFAAERFAVDRPAAERFAAAGRADVRPFAAFFAVFFAMRLSRTRNRPVTRLLARRPRAAFAHFVRGADEPTTSLAGMATSSRWRGAGSTVIGGPSSAGFMSAAAFAGAAGWDALTRPDLSL